MTKRWMSEEQLAQLPPAMTSRALGKGKPKSRVPTKLLEDEPPAQITPVAPAGMQAMQALGRLAKGEKNKTEQAYEQHLDRRRMAGEVLWYRFEPFRLILADNTTYTPDYLVQLASGHLEVHEVKGHWMDDARVKIKVAAALYPVFRFVAIKKGKKTDSSPWLIEEF